MKPYKLYKIMKWTSVGILVIGIVISNTPSVLSATIVISAMALGFAISGETYERLNKEK